MSEQSDQLVRKLFKKELADLLSKYNATIEAKDHYQGYAECGEDVRMTVYIGDSIDIDLGTYVWAEGLTDER